MWHLHVERLLAPSIRKVHKEFRHPMECVSSKNMQVDPSFVTNVGKPNYLKKIGIREVREEHGRDLCMSIVKMSTLRHLTIAAAPAGEHLVFESLSDSSNSPPLPF